MISTPRAFVDLPPNIAHAADEDGAGSTRQGDLFCWRPPDDLPIEELAVSLGALPRAESNRGGPRATFLAPVLEIDGTLDALANATLGELTGVSIQLHVDQRGISAALLQGLALAAVLGGALDLSPVAATGQSRLLLAGSLRRPGGAVVPAEIEIRTDIDERAVTLDAAAGRRVFGVEAREPEAGWLESWLSALARGEREVRACEALAGEDFRPLAAAMERRQRISSHGAILVPETVALVRGTAAELRARRPERSDLEWISLEVTQRRSAELRVHGRQRLAEHWARRGDLGRAAEAYEQAALESGSPWLALAAAWLHLDRGRPARAESVLRWTRGASSPVLQRDLLRLRAGAGRPSTEARSGRVEALYFGEGAPVLQRAAAAHMGSGKGETYFYEVEAGGARVEVFLSSSEARMKLVDAEGLRALLCSVLIEDALGRSRPWSRGEEDVPLHRAEITIPLPPLEEGENALVRLDIVRRKQTLEIDIPLRPVASGGDAR